MDHDQRPRQCAGLGRQGVHAQNLVQRQQHHNIDRALGDIIPQKQFFCIIICLFKVLRADAAANDRNHRQAHGIADNAADGVQVVGHRVGRDMHRAEQRDHRDDKHAAQLEQAVLKRRRDADVQNAFDRAALKAGDRLRRDAQLVVLPRGQRQNDARTDSAGDQRGHGDARDTHFQHEHAERVAAEVDTVDDDRDLHRHRAVARGAEDGRPRVVKCQKRKRQRRDRKVSQARLHDLVGDGAKEKPQLRRAGDKAERRHTDAEDRAQAHELARAFGGILGAFGPQMLACDDSTAGGQRTEQRDDQLVDHIDERHTGNCGLTH